MNAEAIENALKARLATYAALPKAWPNQDFTLPPVPSDAAGKAAWGYIACDLVKASTRDRTLDADDPESVGRLIATVVVLKGASTSRANRYADAIAALFPMGQRIAGEGLTITVTQPPHAREGMTDGAYWRVPVVIPYLAT